MGQKDWFIWRKGLFLFYYDWWWFAPFSNISQKHVGFHLSSLVLGRRFLQHHHINIKGYIYSNTSAKLYWLKIQVLAPTFDTEYYTWSCSNNFSPTGNLLSSILLLLGIHWWSALLLISPQLFSQPWFDQECITARTNLFENAYKAYKAPYSSGIGGKFSKWKEHIKLY